MHINPLDCLPAAIIPQFDHVLSLHNPGGTTLSHGADVAGKLGSTVALA